jgi:hypothetical protein
MREKVQSVVTVDSDGYGEKVAYVSSGWLLMAIVHASGVKFVKSTRLASPEEGGGGSG